MSEVVDSLSLPQVVLDIDTSQVYHEGSGRIRRFFEERDENYQKNELLEIGYDNTQNLIAPYLLPLGHTDWLYMYGANGTYQGHYNFGKVKIHLDIFGIVADQTYRHRYLGEEIVEPAE